MKEKITAVIAMYLLILAILSGMLATLPNVNCKPLTKSNYIFPAQVIGCWMREPIQRKPL